MKLLSPALRALLDVVSWVVLLLAPRHFDASTSGSAATSTYALVGLSVVVCLCTRYPLGLVPLISLRTRGRLEPAAVPVILLWPWLAGFGHEEVARGFYIATGLALLMLWAGTDHDAQR